MADEAVERIIAHDKAVEGTKGEVLADIEAQIMANMPLTRGAITRLLGRKHDITKKSGAALIAQEGLADMHRYEILAHELSEILGVSPTDKDALDPSEEPTVIVRALKEKLESGSSLLRDWDLGVSIHVSYMKALGKKEYDEYPDIEQKSNLQYLQEIEDELGSGSEAMKIFTHSLVFEATGNPLIYQSIHAHNRANRAYSEQVLPAYETMTGKSLIPDDLRFN